MPTFPSLTAALVLAGSTLQTSADDRCQEPNSISTLFAGDSDIEGWNSNCCHFPESKNVGVGGDTCADVLLTIDANLAASTPEWVVLVCGENNFPADSAEVTFGQMSQLVSKINAAGAKVLYMGTKAEPGTTPLHSTYAAYDAMVFGAAETNANLFVVDVTSKFNALGNPTSFYQSDDLHLSEEGYVLWTKWAQEAMAVVAGDAGEGAVESCGNTGRIGIYDGDDDDDDDDDNDSSSAIVATVANSAIVAKVGIFAAAAIAALV